MEFLGSGYLDGILTFAIMSYGLMFVASMIDDETPLDQWFGDVLTLGTGMYLATLVLFNVFWFTGLWSSWHS